MAKKKDDEPCFFMPWQEPAADLDVMSRVAGADSKLMLMRIMAEMGVAAEEYAAFLADDKLMAGLGSLMTDMARQLHLYDDDVLCEEEAADDVQPVPAAKNKSLRIKVQMKDVTKPPMWRELIIPASFYFDQLHLAIQAAMGFDDCHLWMFQPKAFDSDLQITLPDEDAEWTHDARSTPVTAFLAKKGDKLEYVYDFGDDWIFTVTVLDVLDEYTYKAECTKWKGDMQPVEDSGGVWSYIQFRDIYSRADSMSAKEKREIARSLGYDKFSTLMERLEDAKFDIDEVNDTLAFVSIDED